MKAGQPRTLLVNVPELGDDAQVEIRELTLGEQNTILDAQKDPIGAAVKVILVGMTNPRLEPGDADGVRSLGSSAMDRISKAILTLSGITGAAREAIAGK